MILSYHRFFSLTTFNMSICNIMICANKSINNIIVCVFALNTQVKYKPNLHPLGRVTYTHCGYNQFARCSVELRASRWGRCSRRHSYCLLSVACSRLLSLFLSAEATNFFSYSKAGWYLIFGLSVELEPSEISPKKSRGQKS